MSKAFFFFFLLLFSSLLARTLALPTVGVTYSSPTITPSSATTTAAATKPPPQDRIASAICDLRLPAVRLPSPDPSLIRSFSYTNTSLLLSIPNSLVPALAANRSAALRWLYRHVLPFYPRSQISSISVGNDLLSSSPDLSSFLLPSVRNVYFALGDLGIRKITVSTTFSFINTLTTSFPPSSAQFQEPLGSNLIKPLLQFLQDTNSSFLINLYPYNLYRLHCEIPLGFALFQEHPFNFRDDVTTGVRYRNLFDMMVDSVVSAMAVIGYENIPVVVAETGWPSSGGEVSEVEATPAYAEMYLKGLVGHLRSGLGTPLRKEGVAEAYIYELVDREVKEREKGGRNWGILYPNMTKKYDIEFSGSRRIGEGRTLVEMVVVGVFFVIGLLLLQ